MKFSDIQIAVTICGDNGEGATCSGAACFLKLSLAWLGDENCHEPTLPNFFSDT